MWKIATLRLHTAPRWGNVDVIHMVTQAAPKAKNDDLPASVDVAVIGSGLGGLCAAVYLAQRGLRVAVFESHYVAGGCATQFERGARGARYRFDVGLHYIGDCREDGTIPRILGDLGTEVEFAEMDPDGFDELVYPDLRFRIPADLERYRARLVEAFPHEKRGIDRYVTLVGAVMRLARVMDVYAGRVPPVTTWPRLAIDGLRMAPHREATIGAVLDGWIRDPKLRAVLCGQHGDYGLAPSQVSAALHLGLAGHYFRGAFYPKGGGQVIADRVAARLEALGGSVHLRCPVERVLVEDGRAVGLRVAPNRGPACDVRARVVVSNADLKRTLLELVEPEALPAAYRERARGFTMAAPLFMTFLGVRGDLRDLGMRAANYWQMDDYDLEGAYRERERPEASVRGCYVTSGSVKDPENAGHHAPEGESTVEVMALVPGGLGRWGVDEASVTAWRYRRDAAYAEHKQAIEDQLVARLDHLFPGAAERVTYRESATPITHLRFTGATGGTGYGIACTPGQFMGNRPGYRTPLPGLYLAGASTRSGHGIVGAMMSGRACAARVLQETAKSATVPQRQTASQTQTAAQTQTQTAT
jgi:all-trans-retinol 13,14-reductase